MICFQQRDLEPDKTELVVRVICTRDQAERLRIDTLLDAARLGIINANLETFEDHAS